MMKKLAVIGNSKKLTFELTGLDNDFINIRMLLKTKNISSDDLSVYLPTFINDVKIDICRLEYLNDNLKYKPYFDGMSLEEIVKFIISTRDENSKYFDLEDDNIYPAYNFFDWGETCDHFTCFLIPFNNELYLSFDFSDEQYEISPKYQFLKITPYELIKVLSELLERIKELKGCAAEQGRSFK